MFETVILLLCASSVFSQYDYFDTSKQQDQVELINDINNLVVTNTANQNNGEEVLSQFPGKLKPGDPERFGNSKKGVFEEKNSHQFFPEGS